MSGPCATDIPVVTVAASASTGPASVLSTMMSTSSSPSNARSRCRSSWAVTPIIAGSDGSKPGSRGTGQVLSPDAASTTSWPASWSAHAKVSMNDSMPPYAFGGMGIHGGAMMPILMSGSFERAPQPRQGVASGAG